MKGKPDVSAFGRPPKDPAAFLDGAFSDVVEAAPPVAPRKREKTTVTIEFVKPEPTVQKLFRLRWDIANALKLGAAQESAASGRRVTETEIVERLISTHFDLDR